MDCTSCDPTTQYCYQQLAGIVGAAPVIGCNMIPAACAATPTCACVTANTTTTCGAYTTCAGEGSLLTLTCTLP